MIRFPHNGNIAQTTFSNDGVYRYTLYRNLGLLGSTKVLFIMANPSIANEVRNDPTMRRALYFAGKLDCHEFLAMNCFALISTDPKALQTHPDPVGRLNNVYLKAAAKWADHIVVAWGTLGTYKDRDKEVLSLLEGHPLLSLGHTQDGHPPHPLYLRSSTELIPFEH